MTKGRAWVFLALLLALMGIFALSLAEEAPAIRPVAKYIGVAQQGVSIRTEMRQDAQAVGFYSQGDSVRIVSYEPSWLEVIKTKADGSYVTGYILRHTVDDVISIGEQPLPYGATPAVYTAVITQETPLRDAPDDGAKTLFTLTEGSRMAILSIENGWAKVIYWRQYAYFYLGAAADLTPIYDSETATEGDAVTAFISFYRIDSQGLNPNRMVNIKKACEYISITLAPGERFAFDSVAGPYRGARGYLEGLSFFEGETVPSYGGGVCQVSSTMYNALIAVPHGIEVIYRRAHGPSGATYLPHGVDAAVGGTSLDLIFRNTYDFPVRIDASAHDGVLLIELLRGREDA